MSDFLSDCATESYNLLRVAKLRVALPALHLRYRSNFWHAVRIDLKQRALSAPQVVGDRAMATYLNPDSDVMPCVACGRDVSSLLFQSMTIDVACRWGAPIVIGRAFGDTHQHSVGSRFHL